MNASPYIKSFFEKGRVVFNDESVAQNRQLFKSVLIELHTQHSKFIQECNKENILKIDHKNLIIELVL